MILSLKGSCVKSYDKIYDINNKNIHVMNIRNVHYLILGFLVEKPLHGYQIYKNFDDPDGIGIIWKIKITNIYGLLDALEKNKFIAISTNAEIENSYPPKKYFEITRAGRDAFQRWMTTPVKHGREIRQVFLSKLFFAKKMNEEVFNELIHEQIKECKTWLKNITQITSEKSEFGEMVNSFRKIQILSFIQWLEGLNETE